MGVSKIRDMFLGIPVFRIIVFCRGAAAAAAVGGGSAAAGASAAAAAAAAGRVQCRGGVQVVVEAVLACSEQEPSRVASTPPSLMVIANMSGCDQRTVAATFLGLLVEVEESWNANHLGC